MLVPAADRDDCPVDRSLIGAQPTPILAAVFSPPSTLSSAELHQHLVSVVASTLVPLYTNLFQTIKLADSRKPQLGFLRQLRPVDLVLRLEGRTVDDALVEAMAVQLDVHDEQAPLWRVLYAMLDQGDVLIGFLGQHSLFDGSAALAIARTLFNSLPDSRTESTAGSVVCPPSATLPPSLESLVNVAPSTLTLLGTVFKELLLPQLSTFVQSFFPSPPTFWVGGSTCNPPRSKHHRSLHTTPDQVEALVKVCRERETTVTSFLHSAIALSIRPLTNGQPLESNTAVNARPFLSQPVPAYAGSYVGSIISFPSNADSVWEGARVHHAALKAPGAIERSTKVWGMLAYVPEEEDENGWVKFFERKMAKRREGSFEVSNLGRTSLSIPTTFSSSSEDGVWQLKRTIFTQNPPPTSAALVFSVLTSQAGMDVALSWEDGVLVDPAADGDGVLARLLESINAACSTLSE